MDNDHLKEQILKQFRDKLSELDLDVKVVERDSLPDDKELSINGQFLEYIGDIGTKAVWVIKKLIKNVYRIIEIIVVLTTFSIYLKNIFIPKSYDILQNINFNINNHSYFNIINKSVINQNFTNGYVIFKPHWIDNIDNYNNDDMTNSLTFSQNNLTEHTYALPVSGSTLTVKENIDKLNIDT